MFSVNHLLHMKVVLAPLLFFTLGNQILLYVIRSIRSILLIDAPVTTSNSNVMSLRFTRTLGVFRVFGFYVAVSMLYAYSSLSLFVSCS